MKTLRRIFCALLAAACLSAPATVRAVQEDTTVYITKTGECYHRGFCWHLSKSKIAVTLQEATDDGYRPCKNCRPPRLTFTQGGEETAPAYDRETEASAAEIEAAA